MKVKTEADCSCGGNFVYFAGPGGSRRVCTVCLNQQTGIDIVVNLHQSDDPPEMEVCNRCGYVKYLQDKQCTFCASVDGNPPENECECCMSTIGWELNEHGGKVCAACVAFLEFADGRNLISDSILEQQEKLAFENIENEYFDLSSDKAPF